MGASTEGSPVYFVFAFRACLSSIMQDGASWAVRAAVPGTCLRCSFFCFHFGRGLGLVVCPWAGSWWEAKVRSNRNKNEHTLPPPLASSLREGDMGSGGSFRSQSFTKPITVVNSTMLSDFSSTLKHAAARDWKTFFLSGI